MPENIFKHIALDILRLHQQTCRSLLATQDIKGLVRWSQGLYDPPSQFVDW